MDQQQCTKIITNLFAYLQAWSSVRPLDDGCLVVTPFQHYDHSFIELYVEFREGYYHISDDGETLAMLSISGLPIVPRSPLFQVVQRIAYEQHVQFEDDILTIQAQEQELGTKIALLIHTIQRVGYLIYRRNHRKRPTFKDEVESLIRKSEVLYTPDYTIRGNANTHTIDFHINSGRNILIDTLSATNVTIARERTQKSAYKHLDLQAGGVDHRFALVMDDREEDTSEVWHDEEIQNTFASYFAHNLFFWTSEQKRLLHMLKDKDTVWIARQITS
jgi:hypothetical protein